MNHSIHKVVRVGLWLTVVLAVVVMGAVAYLFAAYPRVAPAPPYKSRERRSASPGVPT